MDQEQAPVELRESPSFVGFSGRTGRHTRGGATVSNTCAYSHCAFCRRCSPNELDPCTTVVAALEALWTLRPTPTGRLFSRRPLRPSPADHRPDAQVAAFCLAGRLLELRPRWWGLFVETIAGRFHVRLLPSISIGQKAAAPKMAVRYHRPIISKSNSAPIINADR